MLEKVIDAIISKITREVLSSQMNQIPVNYLMTCNIPDSVKHFFDQEVEIWLREESDKFTSNERFNYDSPEVRVLIDKIFDILKNNATLHVNKFNQLLERAIKLEANYLIRPHQTLTQFLFKNSPVITTMEVYDMLKYFDKLRYYKDALTDYFNLKYLREISQNHFEELISGIDKQVFSKDRLNTTLQTIKAIINFCNEGGEPSENIPLDILIKAFEDRNLDDYKKLVEKEAHQGKQEFSFSNLEVLLRTGQLESKRVETKAVQPEVSVEEVEDIEMAKPEVLVEEISVAPEAAVPHAKEIPEIEEEEEVEEEEEEVVPEVTTPPVEEFVPEEEAAEEMAEVAETDRTPRKGSTAADQLANVVSEKIKGKYLEDLNNIISQKNRKKFVKKIFKKDEHRYSKFIAYVNQLPNWKKATTAIEEMFYQTGINPYSSIAIEFSDLIYNRYFPKDKRINRQEYM
ncbi:MAG: hypothetical protein A2Y94_00585 [Caldithrix sp. RBG_13_44_9]|nr:MAG: hypothetical protein A2Y94_00585 [Caldithrix sp. RBG_13_44_9]